MIDQLRYFVTVCEEGSITAAARRVHVTQPAMTGAIRRLEEEFDTTLLHRGRGGVEPTAEGAALLPRARAVLAAVNDARRAVEEVRDLRTGFVRVGGGATVCAYYLSPVLAEFRAKYPGVRLLVREGTSEATLDAVHSGDLDLAVITVAGGEFWRDDELVLVAAPGVDAAKSPFVTFPPGATIRDALDKHFPEAEVGIELSGIASVIEHTAQGLGVALVSRVSVEDALSAGSLVEVRDRRTPIVRPLKLVHRGVHRLTPAAAALRKMVLEGKGSKRKRRGVQATLRWHRTDNYCIVQSFLALPRPILPCVTETVKHQNRKSDEVTRRKRDTRAARERWISNHHTRTGMVRVSAV